MVDLQTLVLLSPSVIAGLLLVYFLIRPEKLEIWSSHFSRAFSYVSKRAEQATVSREIQGHVNSFKRVLDKDFPGIMPYGMKILWMKTTTPEAFLKDEEIVVTMRHHTNRDKNITTALLAYTPKALIPKARQYVEQELLKSIDFAFIRKLLMNQGYDTALNDFVETIAQPALQTSPRLQTYSILVDDIDARGYLTRILLSEFLGLADKLYPRPAPAEVFDEGIRFAAFLHDIVTKERMEEVPLVFEGRYMKVAIVLVARRGKLDAYGLLPYIKMTEKHLRREYDAVYLCGWGHNVRGTEQLGSAFKSHIDVEKIEKSGYIIRKPDSRTPSNAVCIRLTPKERVVGVPA